MLKDSQGQPRDSNKYDATINAIVTFVNETVPNLEKTKAEYFNGLITSMATMVNEIVYLSRRNTAVHEALNKNNCALENRDQTIRKLYKETDMLRAVIRNSPEIEEYMTTLFGIGLDDEEE